MQRSVSMRLRSLHSVSHKPHFSQKTREMGHPSFHSCLSTDREMWTNRRLSSSGTVPLKPKDGLNGPPVGLNGTSVEIRATPR